MVVSHPNQFDVIIIGAGAGGGTLARQPPGSVRERILILELQFELGNKVMVGTVQRQARVL